MIKRKKKPSIWKGTRYSDEYLLSLNESELKALSKKLSRELLVWSLLFVGVVFSLFLSMPSANSGWEYSELRSSYREEESYLSSYLDSVYGRGNWSFGVYQTSLDAYRIHVSVKNNSSEEHYYRVQGSDIIRVTP